MISGSKPESSSSVGLQTGGEYEVFLSFRGPDVRRTFADCLYSSLVRSKIRTFRDEEDLWKGETIGPSLVKAITESKIHIPIFTIGYASSRWCLQELAKMVDCRKTGGEGGKGQQVILPVFYFITPRDVRHPDSGPYKEAFEVHNQSHDPVTISGWKEALKEVGVMKGWHVTETDGQGAVMDEILIEVESHLRDSYALVTDDLVGIDLHVEEVLKLLNLDSASEKIVGIHGIGGLAGLPLALKIDSDPSRQSNSSRRPQSTEKVKELQGARVEQGGDKQEFEDQAFDSREIEPYVTIWHWDTPQALEAEYGGFLSHEIVKDFEEYCDLLFEEYGRKVKKWITLNEPMVYAIKGYDEGSFAPADKDAVFIGPPLGSPCQFLYPDGLRQLLEYIKETYRDPLIYITENGVGTRREKITVHVILA
ncbi:Disease resistance protein L6 [Linum perenne]